MKTAEVLQGESVPMGITELGKLKAMALGPVSWGERNEGLGSATPLQQQGQAAAGLGRGGAGRFEKGQQISKSLNAYPSWGLAS